MRTVKASEIKSGMVIRAEWGDDCRHTSEGKINDAVPLEGGTVYVTWDDGASHDFEPTHPVAVLAEPEPEWVEGAWYWTQTASQTAPRIRKRMECGWASVGVDGTSTAWLDNGVADITVLGRVLIVDWPGDDVARDIERHGTSAPIRFVSALLDKVADAIRTQGGAR